MRTWIVYLLSLSVLIFMGCASKMERAKIGMMDQTDLEMVKSGLATPLLLLDGLNAAYPKSLSYKFTASQLYTAYGTLLFMEDKNKQKDNR